MEKSTTTHQDAIEQISNDSHSDSNMSGDLAIIHELETHGEVIGVTWRTILAASVSNWLTSEVHRSLTIQSMGMCYNAYLFTLLIPPAILAFINAELGPDISYTWITISWNLGGAIFVTVGMHWSSQNVLVSKTDKMTRRSTFWHIRTPILLSLRFSTLDRRIHRLCHWSIHWPNDCWWCHLRRWIRVSGNGIRRCAGVFCALEFKTTKLINIRKSSPMNGVWLQSVFSMLLQSFPKSCPWFLGFWLRTHIRGGTRTTSWSLSRHWTSSSCSCSIILLPSIPNIPTMGSQKWHFWRSSIG